MKEIKEINKNRKAKFKRLLTDFVNNRIGVSEIIDKSLINKDLFSITEQYLTHAKRDIMSCETQEDINTRLSVYVNVLLDLNKKYSHVAKCVNSIRKGRFKPELAQKKEDYFGHKMEIIFTEICYIVCFPDDNIKLFCDRKCVNDIQCELPRN